MGPTTDIRIKRKNTAGNEGVSVVRGELYYNYSDKVLYIGNSDTNLSDMTPIATTGYIPGTCTYKRSEGTTGYYDCSDVGTSFLGKMLTLKFVKSGNDDPSVSEFSTVYVTIGETPYRVNINGSTDVLGRLQDDYLTHFLMNTDSNQIDVVSSGGAGSLIWETF